MNLQRLGFSASLFFLTFTLQAQEIVTVGHTSGGGSASGGDIHIDVAMGQHFDGFAEGTARLYGGVLQVLDSGISSSKEEILTGVNVYPNPVQNYFILETDKSALSYRLYDGKGMMVLESETDQSRTEISASHLSSGMYTFIVEDGQSGKMRSYKLIIHN